MSATEINHSRLFSIERLFKQKELQVFDNPFCKMVDFGQIPPDRIFVTKSSTPIEDQDHPNLTTIKDEVMKAKQKEINQRAADNNIEPMKLWDGELPRVEQLIAIPDEMALLVINETTFFRHVAYTEEQVHPLDGPVEFHTNQKIVGNAWMEETTKHSPNPLGAVLFTGVERGDSIMIGTPLAQTDEKFLLKAVPSGYSHMRADIKRGGVRPTVTALREMVEETGFQSWEVDGLSLTGRPFERQLGKSATTLVYTAWSELNREDILRKPKEDSDKLLFFPNDFQAFKEVVEYAPIAQGYLLAALLSLANLQWGKEASEELNYQLIDIGTNFLNLPKHEADKVIKELSSQLTDGNIDNTVFETK